MCEKEFGLGAYLIGAHLIEAAQQFAERTLIAEYGVHTKTAHPAARAFVRERRLAAHLALGSRQLILSNAMGSHIGKG
jgi:hypothetical protein